MPRARRSTARYHFFPSESPLICSYPGGLLLAAGPGLGLDGTDLLLEPLPLRSPHPALFEDEILLAKDCRAIRLLLLDGLQQGEEFVLCPFDILALVLVYPPRISRSVPLPWPPPWQGWSGRWSSPGSTGCIPQSCPRPFSYPGRPGSSPPGSLPSLFSGAQSSVRQAGSNPSPPRDRRSASGTPTRSSG